MIRSMKRHVARASFLAASIAYATAAHAQADEDALRAGVELRKEQRDAEALEAFRKAYAINATPRARAQIALAEQALGRWLEADNDIAAALAAREDPWVVKNRGSLEEAQATIARHLGRLEIASNVPTAEITLDGHPTGKSVGTPIRVAGGDALVEVRADGYAPLRRLIDVPPGGVARETFTLVALADLRAPAPSLSPPSEHVEVAPSSDRSPVAGWIAISASMAFLGLGITETIDRENRVAVYNNDGICPPGHKDAVCGDEHTAANRATIVAIIGYSASALALGTGVFLLTRGTSRTPRAMLTPTLGTSSGGLDFRMRF